MLLAIIKILVPFAAIMSTIPFLIWLERKGAAYIQDRRGPNRASIAGFRLGGLIHSFADVVKLLTKEDITPAHVNRIFYTMAPMITMAVACMTFAVIPFADTLNVNGKAFTMQAADLNIGLLYIFAIGSLSVYGVMLAGWASNNKYALLGGLRSSAQMISYEISMGLSVVSVVLFSGTFELSGIIAEQGVKPWHWNIILQPFAALTFITAVFAETSRLPFDLPEGEAEIVAGFHVEYSSMKFALFFMAEYAHIVIGSAIIVALFFGGWQIPFASTTWLRTHAGSVLYFVLLATAVAFIALGWHLYKRRTKIKWGDSRDREKARLAILLILSGMALAIFVVTQTPFALSQLQAQIMVAVLQFSTYFIKILIFCWVFIWIRWTLPRFRYDQVMRLGWKLMLPAALANVFIYAAIKLLLR